MTTIEINADPIDSNPLIGGDRRMQEGEEQHCEQASSLLTTFVSDTQAYGVMFTVRSKSQSLLVETLELSSVFLANQREIHVIVYTKEGGYQNFQNDPSAWVKIADTNLTPSREGRGTMIPARQFHPVEVAAYNVRAFYITLDTTDLRYSNAPGRPVGSVYAQDEFLQIQVGAGLLEYPFSDRIFEPRVFCGIVHYKRIVDCDKAAIDTTKISYAFLAQHDNMSENVVMSQVNSVVLGSITAILGTDAELKSYRMSASLALQNVNTIVSTAFNPEAYAECVSNTDRKCTALVTEVQMKHQGDVLKKGPLIYRMLRARAEITANLNLGNSMDVTYVGLVPLETEMLVRLDNVPSDQQQGMNPKQSEHFESITKLFLEDKLSKSPAVTILGVRANGQNTEGGRRRLGERQLEGEESLSAYDVSTTVTASLRPPTFVDFDFLVEDAIDKNAREYRDDLVNRRDLQLDEEDSNFFEYIKTIAARPVNGTDRNTNVAPPKTKGAFPGWAIVLILLLLLALTIGAAYYIWKRYFVVQEVKEVQPRRDSKAERVDDYVSQIYENAFRGFDESEAEALEKATGKGSDHNRRSNQARSKSKRSRPIAATRTMPPPPSSGSGRMLQSGSTHSRSPRNSARSIGSPSGYSARGLDKAFVDQSHGTAENAASDYSRKHLTRAPSDRGSGRDIGSAALIGIHHSSRSIGDRRGDPETVRSSRSAHDVIAKRNSKRTNRSTRSVVPTESVPPVSRDMLSKQNSKMTNRSARSIVPVENLPLAGDTMYNDHAVRGNRTVRNVVPAENLPGDAPSEQNSRRNNTRSARNVIPAENLPIADTHRSRAARSTTAGRNADDMSSIGMRDTPLNQIIPVQDHDDDMSSIGDMSVMKYTSSHSKAALTSSQHTMKRNNRRESKASSMGIASAHTVKRNNGTTRDLGSSGIDQQMLQSYMQDPEALLETGGQRG